MIMDQAMHAARLAAAQSALLVLLLDGAPGQEPDSVVVTVALDDIDGLSMDVQYIRNGVTVGGEGV